jgi:hypothetical protein
VLADVAAFGARALARGELAAVARLVEVNAVCDALLFVRHAVLTQERRLSNGELSGGGAKLRAVELVKRSNLNHGVVSFLGSGLKVSGGVIAVPLLPPDAKARLDPSASFPPGVVFNDRLTEKDDSILSS